MRIVSVNVGQPRKVIWRDQEVVTGIFKSPVEGPVMVRRLNLEGDRQADLENHGGRNKAVYAYPAGHYPAWRKELPNLELPWGAFGENFTVEGLKEEEVCIGDEFRFGHAVLAVTQPRVPCYKLGIRMGRDDMVKLFLQSNRPGVYFRVVEEGLVTNGDLVERIKKASDCITVMEINRAFAHGRENISLMRQLVRHPLLPEGFRDHFLSQLDLIEES